MYIFILILFITVTASCQTIENGWKDIKPLHTNRTTIDRLLVTPKYSSPGYYLYDTPDAFLHVTYATGPCEVDKLGRGKYNVAKDTILDYELRIRKTTKLTEFRFKMENYRKEEDPELLPLTHYYNVDDGVDITTVKQNGVEYVGRVSFVQARKTLKNSNAIS